MEPTVAEVVPKVVLKEVVPATGGTRVEQKVRKIREENAKGNWHEAVEAAKKEKPIDAVKISKKAEEIGAERDPTTGLKTRVSGSEEEKRFDSFKGDAELNKKFLEQGYDRLVPAEQKKLRDAVESVINSNPLLSSEFSTLTTAQKDEAIKTILKDPKYASSLKEVMSGVLEQKITIEEQQILDRKDEVTDKGSKKTEAENAVSDLTRQINDLDTALKEFDRSPTAPGLKAVELKSLLSNVSTTQTELLNWRTTLQDVEAELAELQSDKQIMLRTKTDITAKENEITTKKTEVKNAKREVDSRQGKLGRITELQTEEAALREKKVQLEKDKKSKDIDLKKADLELSKAGRQLADLKRVRVDQEEDLVNGMRNAVSEAANKYLMKEVDAAEIAFDKELEEAKKKTSSADEQAVYNAERKRWERIENAGTKKEKILVSKEKTAADFADLIKTGSPDNIIREMLKTQVNVRTGVAYTDTDIDVLFADKADGSFYKKMAPEVITQVLRRKILAGGITRADVFNIQNSQWGEGMIRAALDKNKAVAAEMETLLGEKAINPGFMPKLWEQTKKHPWFLLSLLGIIALPILAAKEGTSSIVR